MDGIQKIGLRKKIGGCVCVASGVAVTRCSCSDIRHAHASFYLLSGYPTN